MLIYFVMQCEADAVAFTEEAQQGLSAASASELGPSTWPGGLPWAPDGGYALTPSHIGAEEAKLRVETCLVKPRTGPLEAVSRTRVVHHLKRQAHSREWQIDSIEVCISQCEFPERQSDAAILPSCEKLTFWSIKVL